MRKLLSHAFSESALREQELLLTHYFELLIEQLHNQIDQPNEGRVDLTQWYNYTTFDIMGDLCFGESFNTLARGAYTEWIAKILFGVKFYRFLIIGAAYPLLGLPLKLLGMIPAVQRDQRATWDFPAAKTEKRLNSQTDRKDFVTYVGCISV